VRLKQALDSLPSLTINNCGTVGIPLITRPDDSVTNVKQMYFTGAGVSADTTKNTGAVTVNIPGGGGDGVFTSTSNQDIVTVNAPNNTTANGIKVSIPTSTGTTTGRAIGVYKIDTDTKPTAGLYTDGLSFGAGGTTGEDTWFNRIGGSTLKLSSNRSTGAAKFVSTGLIAAGRSTAPT